MMRDAIERHSSFNLIHYETAFKVDIFIQKLRAFDKMQLERRKASVITTDPDQRRDILGVLKTRAGELDLDYMRKWAKELKVSDLLERAYNDAA